MQISEKIKTASFKIATIGSLGEWWFGGVIASLLAIPILLLQSIYWLSLSLFYWIVSLGSILFLLAIQWTLKQNPDKPASNIVLDKVIGMIIALAAITLKWRVIIFAFALFHFLNIFRPFNFYKKLITYMEKLPDVFGILGGDILSGICVNLLLQAIAWIMK